MENFSQSICVFAEMFIQLLLFFIVFMRKMKTIIGQVTNNIKHLNYTSYYFRGPSHNDLTENCHFFCFCFFVAKLPFLNLCKTLV